jgi:hypothetical protein
MQCLAVFYKRKERYVYSLLVPALGVIQNTEELHKIRKLILIFNKKYIKRNM